MVSSLSVTRLIVLLNYLLIYFSVKEGRMNIENGATGFICRFCTVFELLSVSLYVDLKREKRWKIVSRGNKFLKQNGN